MSAAMRVRISVTALAVAVVLALPARAEFAGRAQVIDGDTITVAGRDVRMKGIDAPESDQPHGAAAARALRRRVGGERVRVESHGRGTYGRIIGTVRRDGRNVNRWLVKQGHAWVYDRYADDPRLRVLERRARRADRGLWARPDPIPPWRWRDGERRGGTASGPSGGDRDCGDFTSWDAAQAFHEDAGPGDPHRLDGDGDGIACESLR